MSDSSVSDDVAADSSAQNHAFILFFHIVYLQSLIRTVQALHCTRDEGGYRLQVEPSVVCYEGWHLGATIFASVLVTVPP